MIAALSSLLGLFWFACRYILWQDLRDEIKNLKDENAGLRKVVIRLLEIDITADGRIKLLEENMLADARERVLSPRN